MTTQSPKPAETTKAKQPAKRKRKPKKVTYCPRTFETGPSLESRPPRHNFPYPQPVTVAAKEVIVVETEDAYGPEPRLRTFAIPISRLSRLIPDRGNSVKITKLV